MFTLQPGPSTCNNSQLTTPARHPPTSQPHQPTQQETVPRLPDAEKLVSIRIQSSSRRNFAKNVAVLAFTRQERMTSNVKGVLGKKQLSPNRIKRIKQVMSCLITSRWRQMKFAKRPGPAAEKPLMSILES